MSECGQVCQVSGCSGVGWNLCLIVCRRVEHVGVCVCHWVCPQGRGHALCRLRVPPRLSLATSPGSCLKPVGSGAPLTPPHPQHHLTSHAACQCCSEHAHAHIRANSRSPEPPKPPPGTLALHLAPMGRGPRPPPATAAAAGGPSGAHGRWTM